MKKKVAGYSALAILGAILMILFAVGIDWEPTPATCEPHGLRQMPC